MHGLSLSLLCSSDPSAYLPSHLVDGRTRSFRIFRTPSSLTRPFSCPEKKTNNSSNKCRLHEKWRPVNFVAQERRLKYSGSHLTAAGSFLLPAHARRCIEIPSQTGSNPPRTGHRLQRLSPTDDRQSASGQKLSILFFFFLL